MDIILTNSIIMIGIGAIAATVVMIILAFMLRLRYKRKKFNLLTIKKLGGVKISDEERMFLIKNKNIKMKVGRRIRTFSMKKLKKKFVDFFNELNPKWYKKQIDTLKKEVREAKASESQARRALQDLRKIKEERPKVIPVPKKKKKEESAIEKMVGKELASISTFA